MTCPVPKGYEQLKDCFGDIESYIDNNGHLNLHWEFTQLSRVLLPFPIPLSWDKNRVVTSFRCHKKMKGIFRSVFQEIQDEGLKDYIKNFGGCYHFRTQRNLGSKLSTHSWGIAIDLNTDTNQQGTDGDMDESLIELFKKYGFVWGGDWDKKDPMHLQFCSDY